MRSISKIKSAVDKRTEDKPIPVKKTLKTPASVRDKEKKDDDTLKIQKQLTGQIVALQKAIRKGHANLDQIRDEIVEKTEKAANAGSEIIDATKKRADVIINEAHSTKTQAKNLLNTAKKQSKDLDKFEKKLKKWNIELGSLHEQASSRIKRATDTLKNTQEKDQKALEKLKESQELLDTMLSLLVVVLEKVIPIASGSEEMLQIVSTNVAKADKMYLEILNMENAVRIEKEVNTTRSDELDKKEIWLKDRISMVGRAEKEVKG